MPASLCTIPSILTIVLLAATLACAMPDPINPQLDGISRHAGHHAAGAIAAMPFLNTPAAGADLAAVTSLADLAARDPAVLHDLLQHPALTHNGITDALTWRIAPYASLHAANPRQAESILDARQWRLSRYAATLPDHRYQATIGILAPADLHNPPAVDVVAEALRTSWELAGQPPPTTGAGRHLAVTVVLGMDLGPDLQAHAADTHIAVSRRHSRQTPAHRWILAHETAHLWWRDNAAWVDEGMAEFIAATVTAAPQPPQARTSCAALDLIAWLTQRAGPHPCDMSLGHRLFTDLHDTAPEHFKNHIQALYRLSRNQSLAEADLRRIFKHPRYASVTDQWLPQPDDATLPKE